MQEQLQQQHQHKQQGLGRNEPPAVAPPVLPLELGGVARLWLLEPRNRHPPAPDLFSGTRSVTLQDIWSNVKFAVVGLAYFQCHFNKGNQHVNNSDILGFEGTNIFQSVTCVKELPSLSMAMYIAYGTRARCTWGAAHIQAN